MSNLLNAIAQSEQQHQAQSSMPARSVAKASQQKRIISWLFPAVLVVAPVAGTVTYSHSQSMDSATISGSTKSLPVEPVADSPLTLGVEEAVTVSSKRVTQNGTELVLGEGEMAIRFLPYPDLRTEPLPSLNRQFASRMTGTAASASTRQSPVVANEPVHVSAEPQAEAEWGLEGLDYSELSPQLAEQLKSAIAATDSLPLDEPSKPDSAAEPVIQAIALAELPASVQSRIPPLDFQTHIYSSTADSRWVKVNGREAFEGDEIAPGVTLRRIEPRQVVFDFEAYLVEMPALSEW